MITSHTFKRLEQERDFQETKLRNLLHAIYVEDGRAWDIWTYEVETHGLDKTLKRITERPKSFGPLKGRIRLGFLKDKDVEDRDRALKEIARQSERWLSAKMQVDHTKERIKEVSDHTADVPKDEQERPVRDPQTEIDRGR